MPWQVFTSLDLMKEYYQVRVVEESKHKTAFTCHQGLFQYWRILFGLTNMPATFQRLMSKLFPDTEWNLCLLVSKSVDEHVGHIQRVLQRLPQAQATEMPLCLRED